MPSLAVPRRSQIIGMVLLFGLLALVVYGTALRNQFVQFDDGLLITHNPIVTNLSWHSVWRAFTSYDPELYIPLTLLSYQLDMWIGSGSPVPFHATSLFLHTINALLVAWLAFLFIGRRWIAVFVGLLFLLHPLHTEAVAWASARKDVLSTALFLGSWLTFHYAEDRASRRLLFLSVGLFLLALLAKVVVLTLPVILLLLCYRAKGSIDSQTRKVMIPYVVLAGVFALVALFGKVHVTEASTLTQKILVAIRSSVFYLEQLVWPAHLNVFYPVAGAIEVSEPAFAVPLVLAVFLLFLVGVSLRSTREIAVWTAFYIVTLAPTFINIAKGERGDFYFASDRYAYIPSIAVFLLLGFGLRWLASTRFFERMQPLGSRALVSICVVILLFLGVLAHRQSLTWRDTKSLFTHVLAHAPAPSYIAHNGYANALRQEGDLEGAVTHYEKSLALRPHVNTYCNLGVAYRMLKRFSDAQAVYEKAQALDPKHPLPLFGLGLLYAAQGRFHDAIAMYEQTLLIDPDAAEVYINLGTILDRQGRTDEAADAFERAVAVNEFHPDGFFNLAVVRAKQGRTDEAIIAYERAIDLAPKTASARINLGLLLLQQRRRKEAVEQFKAILRFDPRNAAARSALMQLGEI